MVAHNCPVEVPRVELGDVGRVLELIANAITWAMAVLWLPLLHLKVLPAKKVHPPKEKKALKWAVSVDTLTAVSKELDAELAKLGLSSVSLDVKTRMFTVDKPFEFMGSKSAEGAGAFKDPEAANKVAREIALALASCNKLLKKRGYPEFGLVVEGHASADFGSAHENSTLRADSVMSAIRAALIDHMGARRGRKAMRCLSSVGHGATRPLAEYSDGGNHPANRRVEIHLKEHEKEGESPCAATCCAWLKIFKPAAASSSSTTGY